MFTYLVRKMALSACRLNFHQRSRKMKSTRWGSLGYVIGAAEQQIEVISMLSMIAIVYASTET